MNGLMHCSKIASLFDHLVSAERGHRHVRADRRRGLEIDHESGVVRWTPFVRQPEPLVKV